nr:hypothetical protein [Propionibacterium sp.]
MTDASRPTVDAVGSGWPIDPRTGEPRRPWLAWLGGGLLFSAAAVVVVALLLVMWDSVTRFPEAAWLNRVVPTNLGDPVRVLLVVGDFAIALIVSVAAVIAGFYGWAGHRWARWASLVALGLGAGTFALNWLAPWGLLPLAAGAVLWWLPPLRGFFAAWDAVRHPQPARRERPAGVVYGPLPRYR